MTYKDLDSIFFLLLMETVHYPDFSIILLFLNSLIPKRRVFLVCSLLPHPAHSLPMCWSSSTMTLTKLKSAS